MMAPQTSLTGVQRAAVLIVALGVETASKLLPALSDQEVERVTVEVARLRRVPSATVEDVLRSYFRELLQAGAADTAHGGLDAARSLLTDGLGEDRAKPLLQRVEAATEGTGFDLARRADPERFVAFVRDEHPQTIAVVLSQLEARPAAEVLTRLPEALRNEVVRRLSTLKAPTPEALRGLDAVLRRTFGAPVEKQSGGPKRVADILTQTSRDASRSVLESLQARDPDLASQIEGLIFTFDDLAGLSGRALGRVLAGVDPAALALALRGVDESFRDKVFGAISERVSAAVQEEMDLAAPAKVSDVEDAQRRIAEAALELAEKGEIEIGEGEAEAATI